MLEQQCEQCLSLLLPTKTQAFTNAENGMLYMLTPKGSPVGILAGMFLS
jgi:hypothetical protein